MYGLRKWLYGVFLLASLSLLGVSGPVAGAISGAIYTSKADGATVNANLYDIKADVYLNGGPPPNAPCTSGGLTSGEYYFQVTDPSGSTLLSTDAVTERKFLVSGGVITTYLGATHLVGLGKCPGAISIQLMPFNNTPNAGGEYKVWVTPVSAYVEGTGTFGFVGGNVKTDNFKVKDEEDPGPGPGPEVGTITGIKFYDSNTDGLLTAGESGIFGWRIEKVPPPAIDYTTTDVNGVYMFINVADGDYTITESTPLPGFVPAVGAVWIPTTPLSGNVTVAANDATGPDFGNVCIGPGGGKTLGFWSNKNGQKLFTNTLRLLLVSYNLRNANGTDFNPGGYSAFRTWLLNAKATNMAYMLSAQMAAMALNVGSGLVVGTTLVYAPELLPFAPVTGLNALGFISVNDLIAAANTELGLHGLVLADSPYRSYQEALKNALDRGNNDMNFVVAPTHPNFAALCPIEFE